MRLGILSGGLIRNARRPFGPRTEQLAALLRTAESMGERAFVFLPDEIDWRAKRVVGLSVRRDGTWQAKRVALPDVVYNRVPNRKLERTDVYRDCLQELDKRLSGRLFNPRFLDKALCLRSFMLDPSVGRFTPETVISRRYRDVVRLAMKHGGVFIKDVDGHAGSGIWLLQPTSGGWELRSAGHPRTAEVLRGSHLRGDLSDRIRRILSDQPSIVQAAVHLAEIDGRRFDFRCLLQRGDDGRWTVTGIGVRRAPCGGITTHVPRGGSIVAPHEALAKAFGSKRVSDLLGRVRRLGLRAVHCIERTVGVPFGEASLDIGLDREGRPWLFEANSKPMKFDEPSIGKAHLRGIVSYARYLNEAGPPAIT